MWLIEFIAYALLSRAAWTAAHSIIVMSCKVDHGHEKEHAQRCYCRCHKAGAVA